MMQSSLWRKFGLQVVLANALAFLAGGLTGLLYANAFILVLMAAAFAASRIWPDKIWFRRLDSH